MFNKIFLISILSLCSHVANANIQTWIGNFTKHSERSSDAVCSDHQPVASNLVQVANWDRQRATVTSLCVEVYVAGVTDIDQARPGILDVYVLAPNKFPLRFVSKKGNNWLYALNLLDLDPVVHGSAPSGNTQKDLQLKVQARGLVSYWGFSESAQILVQFR